MPGRNPAAPDDQDRQRERTDGGHQGSQPDDGSCVALSILRERVNDLERRIGGVEDDVDALWRRSGEFSCVACGERFFVEDAGAVHRSHGLLGNPGRVRSVDCPNCDKENSVDQAGMTAKEATAKADAATERGDSPPVKDADTGEVKSEREESSEVGRKPRPSRSPGGGS